MFPRREREREIVIQPKNLDRIGIEDLIEVVYGLKDEIESLRRDIKGFIARQNTWEDLKRINEELSERERLCTLAEKEIEKECEKDFGSKPPITKNDDGDGLQGKQSQEEIHGRV